MGIKELEKHLRDLGDKEIAAIEKEKQAKLKELKDQVSNLSKKARDEIISKGGREVEATKRRIIAGAKIKAREILERERIRIIDSVFEEAEQRVLKASDAKKKEILKKLADEAVSDIKNPVFYTDAKNVSLLPFAKKREMGFGVIVECGDGSVTIDNTLKTKLGSLREDTIHRVVDTLFSK